MRLGSCGSINHPNIRFTTAPIGLASTGNVNTGSPGLFVPDDQSSRKLLCLIADSQVRIFWVQFLSGQKCIIVDDLVIVESGQEAPVAIRSGSNAAPQHPVSPARVREPRTSRCPVLSTIVCYQTHPPMTGCDTTT